MKKIFLLLLAAAIGAGLKAQTKYPDVNKEISEGNFSKAETMIKNILADKALSDTENYNLNFQIDVMNRIRLDFDRTEEYVKNSLKKYYPVLDEDMLAAWEKNKSLEMKTIDGKKMFFHNAVPNLFRINAEAKKVKQEIDGSKPDAWRVFLKTHLPESVKESEETGKIYVNPVRMKISYTLTVDSNAVPAGEVIRCWLPYPRSDEQRQKDIKLLSVNSSEYIIADDSHPQKTLYMEKIAEKGKPTVFQMQLEYTAYSEFHNIDPSKVKPYDKTSEIYKEYTSERPPHIVFTDEVKKLSQEIVGSETDTYEKVKKIYTWINNNIPWASAREYSTVKNLSSYCINNLHGDCGIKTLLFMTLARYNGIPCKWQSGWMMHPGGVNLHDWGEIYLNGYGVPLDQDFGIQDSQDPKVKYYYIGGLDSYRLVVNNDYGQPLFPAKIYPRSETNDFQRGEVEWSGGNLYFDKWDYHLDVEYMK